MILYLVEELKQAQVGYSVDEGGESLTGTGEGDWRENWLVIGYEDECGDPIFIDVAEDDFPVYTSVHGCGNWEPNLIAVSFNNFIKALSYIKEISIGRESPVERERNPVPSSDRARILETIANENPKISLTFWEIWLQE